MESKTQPFRRIIVRRAVLEVMRSESRAAGKKETGGALVGYVSNLRDLIVVYASGPGPRAKLEADSVLIDGRYTTSFCNELFTSSAGVLDYVGDWHRHPSWSLRASPSDLAAMQTIDRAGCCATPHPVSVIYRTLPEKLAGYIYFQRRLRKAPVTLSK